MDTRTTRYFLHMLRCLGGFAMNQNEVTWLAFGSYRELIAPPGLTTSFIQFFESDLLTAQILANKDFGGLYILAILLDTKGVVASRESLEKGCPSTCEG